MTGQHDFKKFLNAGRERRDAIVKTWCVQVCSSHKLCPPFWF